MDMSVLLSIISMINGLSGAVTVMVMLVNVVMVKWTQTILLIVSLLDRIMMMIVIKKSKKCVIPMVNC